MSFPRVGELRTWGRRGGTSRARRRASRLGNEEEAQISGRASSERLEKFKGTNASLSTRIRRERLCGRSWARKGEGEEEEEKGDELERGEAWVRMQLVECERVCATWFLW